MEITTEMVVHTFFVGKTFLVIFEKIFDKLVGILDNFQYLSIKAKPFIVIIVALV